MMRRKKRQGKMSGIPGTFTVSGTVLSILYLLSINDESRKILEQESGGIRIIIYEG